MTYEWIRETPPVWDANKAAVVGAAATGVFDTRFDELSEGAPVPGSWWRVEEDGNIVGFGWLDVVWGDAEILLATHPDAKGKGVGAFIIEQLEAESRSRGLRYIYNTVRSTHPQGKEVTQWLSKRGFEAKEDGRLVKLVPLN